jgi:hypothetical protein
MNYYTISNNATEPEADARALELRRQLARPQT